MAADTLLPGASNRRQPRLALGTVQFGLAYGIAGSSRAVPEDEVRQILEDACARGVRTLDTAAAYGDIEERLGRLIGELPLTVVSKIPALPASVTPAEASAFVLTSAQTSRRRLGGALRGLMMHKDADLTGPCGQAVAEALRRWTEREDIAFGASCYSPEAAAMLVRRCGIRLAQIPGSALDQRVVHVDVDALQHVELHMRSVFLQGLLLMRPDEARRRLPAAAAALERWEAHCRAQCQTPLDAALSIAKSFDTVDEVIVGVDGYRQWVQTADAWDHASPRLAPELSCESEDVINPQKWKVCA